MKVWRGASSGGGREAQQQRDGGGEGEEAGLHFFSHRYTQINTHSGGILLLRSSVARAPPRPLNGITLCHLPERVWKVRIFTCMTPACCVSLKTRQRTR